MMTSAPARANKYSRSVVLCFLVQTALCDRAAHRLSRVRRRFSAPRSCSPWPVSHLQYRPTHHLHSSLRARAKAPVAGSHAPSAHTALSTNLHRLKTSLRTWCAAKPADRPTKEAMLDVPTRCAYCYCSLALAWSPQSVEVWVGNEAPSDVLLVDNQHVVLEHRGVVRLHSNLVLVVVHEQPLLGRVFFSCNPRVHLSRTTARAGSGQGRGYSRVERLVCWFSENKQAHRRETRAG